MVTAAPACRKALSDATLRWPKRNRASDGIIGDAAHQARKSDHNDGNAFDLTHDPANGVDCEQLAKEVIWDNRVTYVIWNRQICSTDQVHRRQADESCTYPRYQGPEKHRRWEPYVGTNPHTSHMHVSIRVDARDDLSPWYWSPDEKPPSDNRMGGPRVSLGA
ncbi:hypothetical protein RB623_04860 [Mesorhizobium sp. LHD-90]|uniref:hypothetical protein n=1 Tax=Mesorhizobium sp. LHD-90 TaxID=3071414 RepID=UPI0027E1FCAD|nr:hypothetical protein [Mesorhizobium sp. LHD-90]MDQ6433378.1 hypothetical protein [Mesorhizobium sp. LHD-90]